MMAFRRLNLGLLVVGLSLLVVGCAGNHIRGDDLYADTPEFQIGEEAEIEDTADAREVLDVLYQYRHAMVSKDFGSLRRLVSEDYYDNAGTTHTTADDYGYDELSEIFEMMANHAQQIRYSVVVRDLVVDGNQAHIDFEYEYAYQYRLADKETWDAGRDVSRLELHREGDRWRIISGL